MKNSFIIAVIFFVLPLPETQGGSGDMKITDFVTEHGYPIKTHEVITEDGYILTLFRIPSGRNSSGVSPNKHPVLLNHALLVSSEIYVVLGPKKSLAFVLADNGYDVWLMNSRGVWHSKRHKTLKTNSKKYWEFSWHEIGVYDIPANIDYILKVTSKPKLHFVGHSQGTSSFFVMGSERPEYNKKIKVMIALAPGARYKYIKNRILAIIAPHYKLLGALADFLKLYVLPPPLLPDDRLRALLQKMCLQPTRLSLICKLVAEIASTLINVDNLPTILSAVPTTFSIKQPLHYAQLIAKGTFQKYDWGTVNNLKKYGTKDPPSYNLKNITCPVALFWGPSDDLVAEKDLDYLREELPYIVEDYKVPFESFNHIDFVIGSNLEELLYKQVLKVMAKYT